MNNIQNTSTNVNQNKEVKKTKRKRTTTADLSSDLQELKNQMEEMSSILGIDKLAKVIEIQTKELPLIRIDNTNYLTKIGKNVNNIFNKIGLMTKENQLKTVKNIKNIDLKINNINNKINEQSIILNKLLENDISNKKNLKLLIIFFGVVYVVSMITMFYLKF